MKSALCAENVLIDKLGGNIEGLNSHCLRQFASCAAKCLSARRERACFWLTNPSGSSDGQKLFPVNKLDASAARPVVPPRLRPGTIFDCSSG